MLSVPAEGILNHKRLSNWHGAMTADFCKKIIGKSNLEINPNQFTIYSVYRQSSVLGELSDGGKKKPEKEVD